MRSTRLRVLKLPSRCVLFVVVFVPMRSTRLRVLKRRHPLRRLIQPRCSNAFDPIEGTETPDTWPRLAIVAICSNAFDPIEGTETKI